MDTESAETRSRIMSKVSQRITCPKILLRSALHKLRLRHRLHDKSLPCTSNLRFRPFRAVALIIGV